MLSEPRLSPGKAEIAHHAQKCPQETHVYCDTPQTAFFWQTQNITILQETQPNFFFRNEPNKVPVITREAIQKISIRDP